MIGWEPPKQSIGYWPTHKRRNIQKVLSRILTILELLIIAGILYAGSIEQVEVIDKGFTTLSQDLDKAWEQAKERGTWPRK